ncbi:Uncharacterized protein dnm_094680 [Desulfonema magnum]|uniref:Uncharacterized protein n=1 Tax=Desulfonema magnum TaxID=45655 RepID=A0A975BXV9_9BACT|nr:Uncharacterized protein dnm_094680 [Desulfonema magnum]
MKEGWISDLSNYPTEDFWSGTYAEFLHFRVIHKGVRKWSR